MIHADRVSNTLPTQQFRFGDGQLVLECDEPECACLFADLYKECAVLDATEPCPTVRCSIVPHGNKGETRISFDGIDPFDLTGFAVSLFKEMDCQRVKAPAGWQAVETKRRPGRIAFSDTEIVASRGSPWRWLVAMLALHLVIRTQPEVFFFHAGSISVRDHGVLLIGPANSGKTTLALALADRGHGFLGDDYAALRVTSNELLPFRRRLSIRPGPCAAGVRHALDGRRWPTRTLTDGSVRYLVHAEDLFPFPKPAPVPLTSIIFLSERGDAPRLIPMRASHGPLERLTPLASTFQSAPPGAVALGLAKLITRVPSYLLEPGTIPETVRLVEELLEN